MADTTYTQVTNQQGAHFFGTPDTGPLVMLNLLRFRDEADYSHAPALAPAQPISGAEAYALYVEGMTPLLEASGGKLLYSGSAYGFLIGPADEYWDAVLLVEQAGKQAFLAFASDPESQAITAHRTAAIADSRLLPTFPQD